MNGKTAKLIRKHCEKTNDPYDVAKACWIRGNRIERTAMRLKLRMEIAAHDLAMGS